MACGLTWPAVFLIGFFFFFFGFVIGALLGLARCGRSRDARAAVAILIAAGLLMSAPMTAFAVTPSDSPLPPSTQCHPGNSSGLECCPCPEVTPPAPQPATIPWPPVALIAIFGLIIGVLLGFLFGRSRCRRREANPVDGLAGAAGADEDRKLAGGDGERDVLEGDGVGGVDLGTPKEFDHVGDRILSPACRPGSGSAGGRPPARPPGRSGS
jgi:hypothetical protein